MKQPLQHEYGSDHFLVTDKNLENMPMSDWYEFLARQVSRLPEDDRIEIDNNSYVQSPSDFVTGGVKGRYRGKDFSIWSDVPGEVIVKYNGKYTDEFIDVINTSWE